MKTDLQSVKSPIGWCAAVLLGALGAVWFQAPFGLVALLSATLLAPAMVTLAARLFEGVVARLAGQHEGAAWALCISTACSITGGPFSPLCGMLLLLPVVTALDGRRQAAIDAAILASIGYGCLLAVHQFLSLPPLPQWAWPLTAFPILSALLWLVLAATGMPNSAAISSVAATTLPRPRRVWRALDADGPVCAVELTTLGRVSSLSGNTALLPNLKSGQLIEAIVSEPGRDAFAQRLQRAGEARLALANGNALRLFVRPHENGTTLYAMPADAEVRAVSAAERAGEEAVKARNLFFASLSHDLKTPLNAILGFADMMRAGLKGPLPAVYRDYADIIHESGEDLMLLVEDILDLAKADADRQTLEIEPIDLAASGRSVMRQMTGQAERRDLSLSLEIEPDEALSEGAGDPDRSNEADEAGPWAMADARAVKQVWQNLLSNAVKYSQPGGAVSLRVRPSGDTVEISVTDEGEGMDANDLAAIAEPFSQGRNAAKRPGTGLGLTVVKRFAELMGGGIDIQSVKGQGTTVRVTFPAVTSSGALSMEDAAE